jgi:hypothetical protein
MIKKKLGDMIREEAEKPNAAKSGANSSNPAAKPEPKTTTRSGKTPANATPANATPKAAGQSRTNTSGQTTSKPAATRNTNQSSTAGNRRKAPAATSGTTADDGAEQALKAQITELQAESKELQAELKEQKALVKKLQTELQNSDRLKEQLEEAKKTILNLSSIDNSATASTRQAKKPADSTLAVAETKPQRHDGRIDWKPLPVYILEAEALPMKIDNPDMGWVD